MTVSFAPSSADLSRVDALAEAAGLGLLPGERQPVAEAFATLQAVSQALLRFPLPDDVESAPVFQP